MEQKFYCQICNSDFPKKKQAKKCKKRHLRINVRVNTKTVLKIFDEFFDIKGKSPIFETLKEISFEAFFTKRIIEGYKNSI